MPASPMTSGAQSLPVGDAFVGRLQLGQLAIAADRPGLHPFDAAGTDAEGARLHAAHDVGLHRLALAADPIGSRTDTSNTPRMCR